MKSITVAPREKFEPLRALPKSFMVSDEIRGVAIEPKHYGPLAAIISDDPGIGKLVSWASLVSGPDDIRSALESRTHGTLLGRYALELSDTDSVIGSLCVFPGEREKEYGFGGAFVEASQRGRGITGKAGLALMNTVIQTLSPNHLYAQISPGNTASIAIATRYGSQPAEMVWDPELQIQEQRFRLELPGEAAA